MQSLVATDTFRIHPLLFLNSDYANHKSRPIPTEKCWVYLESQISKSSIRNPETPDSQIRKHFQEFSNLLKGGLYLPNISYIYSYMMVLKMMYPFWKKERPSFFQKRQLSNWSDSRRLLRAKFLKWMLIMTYPPIRIEKLNFPFLRVDVHHWESLPMKSISNFGRTFRRFMANIRTSTGGPTPHHCLFST